MLWYIFLTSKRKFAMYQKFGVEKCFFLVYNLYGFTFRRGNSVKIVVFEKGSILKETVCFNWEQIFSLKSWPVFEGLVW